MKNYAYELVFQDMQSTRFKSAREERKKLHEQHRK